VVKSAACLGLRLLTPAVVVAHRRVLSGEFTVVNQHLLADLTQLGLWNPMLKNELVAANGSVQVSLCCHQCRTRANMAALHLLHKFAG